MFNILELLGIARYDTSGQLRNSEEIINEWIKKQDLLTWRVWYSLHRNYCLSNDNWYYFKSYS